MNLPPQSDLVIRENLAIQRTIMSNQTTLLAFIRTSMYFLVAGLSIQNLIKSNYSIFISIILFILSFLILSVGILNYFNHKKKILINQNLVDLREDSIGIKSTN